MIKTIKNINELEADEIFDSTGFNYDIHMEYNGDGTVNLTFDSPADYTKFVKLLGDFFGIIITD